MKSLQIIVVSFVVIFNFQLNTSAQETGFMPGFIVTNSNDTIPGFVKNKNSTPYRILQNIKFKKTLDDKVQQFSPQEIIGFQAGSNRYVAKDYMVKENPDMKRSFMEIMIEGDLNYYELRVTLLGVGNEIIYKVLQKKGDPFLFSVYGGKLKERLIEFLYDEPAICDKVEAGKYNANNIDELTEGYNLLKFKPDTDPYTGEVSLVTFYNRFKKKSDLFLSFNDKEEIKVSEGLILQKDLPSGKKTKVCFGEKSKMTCTLISTLPNAALSEYYELVAGSKYLIEKRTTNMGQLHLQQIKAIK